MVNEIEGANAAKSKLTAYVDDLLRAVPEIEQPNIFPQEWHGDPQGKLSELYQRAQDEIWVPARLPWEKLDPREFTREQRLGVMYWYAVLANFDGSGPPVFAKAMIHAYETHEPHEVRQVLASITRDEVNHEDVCARTVSRLWTNNPTEWKPESDLEQLALRNIRWLYFMGGKYWKGYSNALHKYPMSVILSSFMMGEVAATTLFHTMSRVAQHKVFEQGLRNIGKDEARHMAICLELLKLSYPKLTPEEKNLITKQLRAGFVFLSMILYEPVGEFWNLPEYYLETHRELEQKAREAGLGVATLEVKRRVWKEAMLKVKKVMDGYGIEFPAMPEVGISGKEVTVSMEDDIIPVF